MNARIPILAAGILLIFGTPAIAHAQDDEVNPSESDATVQPTRAQQLMGDIAPKMAELTDGVLYADIWERPQLSKRDRSLVTVSALIATNHPSQLRSHLALARQNGVKEEELIEVITHLAFYTGWPNAVTAISVAREVFQNEEN